MRYIIDVPDTEGHYDSEYEMVTMRVHYGSTIVDISMDAKPYTEPDRKAIEDEVWNFAGKIFEMDTDTYAEIYADGFNSYQDAKSKFEAWLKQKDEIHVGDEIVGIYSDGEKTPPLVVLKVEGNYYFGIYSKTGEFVQGGLNYEKTGRHFQEVAELLEKMRREEK